MLNKGCIPVTFDTQFTKPMQILRFLAGDILSNIYSIDRVAVSRSLNNPLSPPLACSLGASGWQWAGVPAVRAPTAVVRTLAVSAVAMMWESTERRCRLDAGLRGAVVRHHRRNQVCGISPSRRASDELSPVCQLSWD
jgi:hypothetical protein